MKIQANKDVDFLIGIGVAVRHTYVVIDFNFAFWYVMLIFDRRGKMKDERLDRR
jgi:hypothetical protein